MQPTHIARHMPSVESYRERLAALQGAWDTLALLSHLAADRSEMTSTRQAFEALSADLIQSLASETRKKAVLALKARAQIAIDILVRNLFERTADIGFLSADEDIAQFVRELDSPSRGDEEELQRSRESLHARLRAYVAKYSVYDDIALLGHDGRVLLKLDQQHDVQHSSDALIAATLSSREPYVETYRAVDIFKQHARSLVYSHRVESNAVLCLCFNLEDEVKRIFAKLSNSEDWTIYAFVDERGQVIASSDAWQIPAGAHLPLALEEDGTIVRFAGRQYLAITRATPGYQGYAGPGWLGYAMLPLEHAFLTEDHDLEGPMHEAVLKDLAESSELFSEQLRRIPDQARRIQADLNRSVWNGNVRLAAQHDGSNNFQKALLREVGNTGRRTQETFENSIADLQRTVVSASSHSASVLASLAVDILDRNLYERANDCRWWALNSTLAQYLGSNGADRERVTNVLRHINSLYTVYHGIVLFDHTGTIRAVSNAGHEQLIGSVCQESWVARTLALRDPQSFAVSDFVPSALYENKPVLIFGAALTSTSGRTLGGIGIVFDTGPQLSTMLADALPRTASGAVANGCIALFVDREQRILSSSNGLNVGAAADLPAQLLSGNGSTSCIVEHHAHYYAAATCATTGYREYQGLGVKAVVLLALGPKPHTRSVAANSTRTTAKRTSANDAFVEIATFVCGEQWLGVMRDCVIEAVDSDSLRRLPGKSSWHAGVVMYAGSPVPVIDLAHLTHMGQDSRAKEIVIVRPAANRMPFGLLVDALSSIPEVSATDLLPIADLGAHTVNRIVDRAVRPDQMEDSVLMVLNLDQVLLATKDLASPAAHSVRT